MRNGSSWVVLSGMVALVGCGGVEESELETSDELRCQDCANDYEPMTDRTPEYIAVKYDLCTALSGYDAVANEWNCAGSIRGDEINSAADQDWFVMRSPDNSTRYPYFYTTGTAMIDCAVYVLDGSYLVQIASDYYSGASGGCWLSWSTNSTRDYYILLVTSDGTYSSYKSYNSYLGY
jgi:hypothetical protein